MQKQIVELCEKHFKQGNIEWEKIKLSGINAVMLRLGCITYKGDITFDEGVEKAVLDATNAGLEVGFYLYSYGKSPVATNRAAGLVADFADKYKAKITLPIAIEAKETTLPCLVEQGREQLTNSIIAFIFEINRRGYMGAFYTSTQFANAYLNMERLSNRILWVQDLENTIEDIKFKLFRENIEMWQGEQEQELSGILCQCKVSVAI